MLGFVRTTAADTPSVQSSTTSGSSTCPRRRRSRRVRPSCSRSSRRGSRSRGRRDVRPGERVLVTPPPAALGGARCRWRGARRGRGRARLGSEEKLEAAARARRERGGHVRRVPGLEPVDVVFDQVGGELFASLALLRPLGNAIGIGFAGGCVAAARPGVARRPQRLRCGLLPRPADAAPARRGARGGRPTCSDCGGRAAPAVVGATYPLAEAAEAHRAGRGAPLDRQGRARPVKAPRDGRRVGHRRGDRRPAALGGLRGRVARPRDRLRRLRCCALGRGRPGRRRVPQRRRPRRAEPTRPSSSSRATAGRSRSTSTASCSACGGSRR